VSTTEVDLYGRDVSIVRLAREIATNLYDIETILKTSGINQDQFEVIKKDPRFQRLLESEIAAWNSAENTLERTKLKAGMLIEEWLPEANALIHDKKELLSGKTEIVKTLARIAGMGERTAVEGGGGERLTVTINLGADHKLSFEKEVTPKVIDVTPTKVES
jgi:hypothetical protein